MYSERFLAENIIFVFIKRCILGRGDENVTFCYPLQVLGARRHIPQNRNGHLTFLGSVVEDVAGNQNDIKIIICRAQSAINKLKKYINTKEVFFEKTD